MSAYDDDLVVGTNDIVNGQHGQKRKPVVVSSDSELEEEFIPERILACRASANAEPWHAIGTTVCQTLWLHDDPQSCNKITPPPGVERQSLEYYIKWRGAHACSHVHTRERTHPSPQVRAHVRTHARMHKHMHEHMHANTHARTHARTHA